MKQIDLEPRSFTIEVVPAPKWPLAIFVVMLSVGIWVLGPLNPIVWSVAVFGVFTGATIVGCFPRTWLQRDR